MIEWSEVILRLGAAALAGGALGLNRDLHGKAIGVRTLGIVALATSSIVVMADIGGETWRLTDTASRLIQGILTGVGFLGAGVIIHAEPKGRIRGLTSAACTWLTACIGILCGAGLWRVVLVSVGITFILLMFGGKLEKSLRKTVLGRQALSDTARTNSEDEEETRV
jgi:putative Mg2+ transporter-C (MgtC) family protein